MDRIEGSEPAAGRVLVAEDSRTNRILLRGILGREGYEVLEADDGDVAVEIARREQPDLILSDVMMPRMDGYAVCQLLKQDPATAEIPVIFLSGQTRTEDKIQGLDVGAADYIAKPFDKREVVARVRAQLRIGQLTRMVMAANKHLEEKQAHLDEALAAAATIQQSLTPRAAPSIPDVGFAWRVTPCEQVGGDIFNVHRVDRDHVAFYMLDVCGHGVPAAMITVSVCQTLAPQAGVTKRVPGSDPGRDYDVAAPGEVIRALDREYPFERFERHFTICYALLDIRSGELTYGNAGHPAPVLLRANGSVEVLPVGGTIVGLGMPELEMEGRCRLGPGDRLFLYTDGIVEQQDEFGTFFGDKRFHELLSAHAGDSLDATCEQVVEAVIAHAPDAQPQDDISLLGVEFAGPERGADGP